MFYVIYSEAENLKLTILSSRDLINDNEARVARQRLQVIHVIITSIKKFSAINICA